MPKLLSAVTSSTSRTMPRKINADEIIIICAPFLKPAYSISNGRGGINAIFLCNPSVRRGDSDRSGNGADLRFAFARRLGCRCLAVADAAGSAAEEREVHLA